MATTHDEAFLEDIIAHPRDDAPRLIYADWLDDHGQGERAEFIRQSALLANIWLGLGARTCSVVEPDRHHFTVIDGLADPDHPLTKALLEA